MTRQDLTEDRMPNPYTVKSFEECKAGDILEINWDKGNGELIAKFEYYGINSFDNSPLLIDVRKISEILSFYLSLQINLILILQLNILEMQIGLKRFRLNT